MNAAITNTAPAARVREVSAPAPASADAWPSGLTLLLFLFATLGATIGMAFYLASQMPT